MGIFDSVKSAMKETVDSSKLIKKEDVSDTESATVYTAVSLENPEAEKCAVSFPPKFCFWFSIAALILGLIPGFSAAGVALGVISLILMSYFRKQNIEVYSKKNAKILAIVAVVIGIVFSFSFLGAALGQGSNQVALQKDVVLADTSGAANAEVDSVIAEEPCVTIEMGDRNQKPIAALQVIVKGTTKSGIPVDEVRTLPLGVSKKLDYEAGSYTFETPEFTSADGKQVYKAASASCTFDGKSDEVVKLSIVLDEEKTAEIAAADEAAKAAAEAEAAAAAQRAAEEKAAAEAAAAAEAQAAARQSQSSSGGGTVYVAASGNGSKYHSSPSCSRMKGTITMSVSQAQAAGYTPCSKCY